MNIEDIRKRNGEKLEELQNHGIDESSTEMKIQKLIKKIVSNDEIFFKMSMDEAIHLLKSLYDVKDEELLEMYNNLISTKHFQELTGRNADEPR